MIDDLDLLRSLGEVDPPTDDVFDRARAALRIVRGDSALPSPSARSARRPGRRRSYGLAAVTAGTVLAAGGGLAEAADSAGWFDSQQVVVRQIGSSLAAASAVMTARDPSSVPGAVVRAAVAGPEGTTLQFVTKEGHDTPTAVGSCWALGVKGSPGHAVQRPENPGACGGLGGPPGGAPLTPQPYVGPWANRTTWVAPSGTRYTIVSGLVAPGATTVELANTAGVAAATQPSQQGWFIIYLPTATFRTFNHVSYDNAEGRNLDRGETFNSPPPYIGW